jgi:uncharacterized protein
MTDQLEMPMFPLGMVLFPTQLLPLRIFEPRYRAMTADLLERDGRFGVVLIERGHEVGGGDTRSDIGTVAQLVQAQPYPDGRYALMAIGVQRLRVRRWLPDDPYPKALVELIDDRDDASGAGEGQYQAAVNKLRGVLALAAELGHSAPASTAEFVEDPRTGSYQLCAASPIGPHDRQRLLNAPSTAARLALLEELLGEARSLFEAQLAMGTDPDDQE